jgi:hypothetical protein
MPRSTQSTLPRVISIVLQISSLMGNERICVKIDERHDIMEVLPAFSVS